MKIFIHGWASGPQVWPASLTKGESFLYDGAEFPEFSDLEQTVKKLWQTRREKMIVVGWSLGGMLALQLAHAHPEWIEKLVLLSSPRDLRQMVCIRRACHRQVLRAYPGDLTAGSGKHRKIFIGRCLRTRKLRRRENLAR